MCIALLSTSHPSYPLILLSNRDEFLDRPTAAAHWWKAPQDHVLGGRDLQKPEQGTWLGVTKDGRLAILTNFKDEGKEIAKDKSRGAIVKAYISNPPGEKETDAEFARRLVEDVGIDDVGGFSLVFGHLQSIAGRLESGLSIISNRTTDPSNLTRIAERPGQVYGLSNSFFGDLTWPKIVHGEQLLRQAINASVTRQDSQERLVESLFDVLSVNTYPDLPKGEDFEVYARQMRNSIFIPRVGESGEDGEGDSRSVNGHSAPSPAGVEVRGGAGVYGTQKQTVVLVDRGGKVTFIEKTLYDEHARASLSEKKYEFKIDA